MIYKNQEIGSGTTSIYTSMLGCKNNRDENLKKLARTTAFRLAKEFLENAKMKDRATNKKPSNKFNIKPTTKIERPRVSNKVVVTSEVKKKKVET